MEWLRANFGTILDFLVVLSSVAYVWLNGKQNIWTWFFAVISSGLSAVIFYQMAFWGDMYLQLFFIGMAFYGFYTWNFSKRHKKQRQNKEIQSIVPRKLPRRAVPVFILIHLGLSLVIFWFLRLFTDKVFEADAFLTAGSILATWLAAKKYIENWAAWVFLDILYVGVFLERKQPLMAYLYAFFAIMAIWGYREWSKQKVAS